MKTDGIEIRRLGPADAELYREIRLEGLRCSPEAFGSTFEAESARPLSAFSERLESGVRMFGAFQGSEIVGVAGLLIQQGQKEAHKGSLVGMYVRADYRAGQGLDGGWVEGGSELARKTCELIELGVVSENERPGDFIRGWVLWSMASSRGTEEDGR